MKRKIIKVSALIGISMVIYFVQQIAEIFIGNVSISIVACILADYIYESLIENK